MDAASTVSSLNNVLPGNAQLTNNNDNGTGLSTAQFLKIMAATMSNPSFDGGSGGSSGGSNTDYLTQLAQFSELDKLNQLGDNMQALVMMNQQQQAFSLLGKNVVVSDTSADGTTTSLISGKVTRIQFNNGYATVQINGGKKYYDMSSLQEVDGDGLSQDPNSMPPTTPSNSGTASSNSSSPTTANTTSTTSTNNAGATPAPVANFRMPNPVQQPQQPKI